MGFIGKGVSFLLGNKLLIGLTLWLSVVFAILLFPPGDLSDIVSEQVTKATGTYTQFDGIEISLIPSPGVRADNILIEPSNLPSISASSAEAGVAVLSALTGRKGANLKLSGLFKGDVEVDFNEGEKLKSGERAQTISVSTARVSLNDVTDYLRSGDLAPVSLNGLIDMKSQLKLDPKFETQPSGTLGLEVNSFVLPSQTIQTQVFPVELPSLELGKVVLQAKMGDGQIEIQEMNFGGTKEGISGKIRGNLGMTLRPMRGGVQPMVGNYQLSVDLVMQRSFFDANSKSSLGMALIMIERFKQESPNEVRYSFNMKTGLGGMPEFTEKSN
jgi:type II secretion system protein N